MHRATDSSDDVSKGKFLRWSLRSHKHFTSLEILLGGVILIELRLQSSPLIRFRQTSECKVFYYLRNCGFAEQFSDFSVGNFCIWVPFPFLPPHFDLPGNHSPFILSFYLPMAFLFSFLSHKFILFCIPVAVTSSWIQVNRCHWIDFFTIYFQIHNVCLGLVYWSPWDVRYDQS